MAIPLRCQAIRLETRLHDGKNSYRYTMHLFGFKADVKRAEVLWTSLLLQAANGIKDARAPVGESSWCYKESWLAGFASAV